jgi:hypothetical protein
MKIGTHTILLFVLLAGGNTTAMVVYGEACQGNADGTSQKDCRMPKTVGIPIGCCPHKTAPLPGYLSQNYGCCQMSAPGPDEPRPALPAASEGARLRADFQLLDSSEPDSPSTPTPLLYAWAGLSLAFCPDCSDTYLFASTFRI